MLHFFTWQQFIYTAAVLVVIYYVTVGLLFFRQELQHYLSGKRKPERLKREWEEELEDEEDLMGQAKEPEGLNSVSLSGLDFGSVSKETQLGVVPDVLEELKSIFYIVERDKGTKEDFISLFDLVSAKYPQIKGSPNQDALNDYIRTNLPFEITDEELENLWQ